VDGLQAYQIAMRNGHSKWPERGDKVNRLYPDCAPVFTPGFRLERGESIFTIGSCFARNIERALLARGFVVPSWDFTAPPEECFPGPTSSALNKYTPQGMLNEVQFALEPESAPATDAFLLEGREGQWADYQLHVRAPVTLERARERREQVRALFRRAITQSRVIIVTLGLIEEWVDTETGIHLNESPSFNMVRKYPGRFQFKRLTHAECRDSVSRMIDMLRAARGNDLRIVVTVSPVPIQRTFTGDEIITANSYSKAVLRVVAEEIRESYDFVDYFPSYESVMLSDPMTTWVDDQVHVTEQRVSAIVNRMADAYSAAEPAADAAE
jgi:hypothetical protein